MEGLRADVARLALGVLRAFLDRLRDGLLVFLIRMILLGPASSPNLLAELVMAAFFPVCFLAGRPAVTCTAAAAFLARSQAKWGSAGGAVCEEYSCNCWGSTPNDGVTSGWASVLALKESRAQRSRGCSGFVNFFSSTSCSSRYKELSGGRVNRGIVFGNPPSRSRQFYCSSSPYTRSFYGSARASQLLQKPCNAASNIPTPGPPAKTARNDFLVDAWH